MARYGYIHGKSKTVDFRRWSSMINRCHCETTKDYDHYGGRGIFVCGRWRFGENGKSGFQCYLSDVGHKPRDMSLDRIDNDGPYSPQNCRWATGKQQSRNRKNNRLVTLKGETMPLVAALEKVCLTKQSFYLRIKHGMTEEEALTTPIMAKAALRERQKSKRYTGAENLK